MPTDLPISSIPGSSEGGFLAAAVTAALVDLLVEKGAISRGEVILLLQSLVERLSHDSRAVSKSATETLENWARFHETQLITGRTGPEQAQLDAAEAERVEILRRTHSEDMPKL